MALLLALLGGGPAGINIDANLTAANATLAATINDPIAINAALTAANATLAATVTHPVTINAALTAGNATLAATVNDPIAINAALSAANATLSATILTLGAGVNIDAALAAANATLASTVTVSQPVIIPSGGGRWNPGSRDFDSTRTRAGRRRDTDALLCDQEIELLLPLFELVHSARGTAVAIRMLATRIAWAAVRDGKLEQLEREIELARKCGGDWLIVALAAERALNRIKSEDEAAITLVLLAS